MRRILSERDLDCESTCQSPEVTGQRLLTSWPLLVEHGREGPGWDNGGGILPPAGLNSSVPPPAAAVMGDTCPLRGLLGCLPDTPVGRPGLAAMPRGSSSRSPPRARGQGSPLPISEYDPARGPQGAGLVLASTHGPAKMRGAWPHSRGAVCSVPAAPDLTLRASRQGSVNRRGGQGGHWNFSGPHFI